MKCILYTVLIFHLDYCLGATSIINPDNLKVVGLRPSPNEIQERSLWEEIMLVTRMTSDLKRRDILDALVVGIKVAEIVPGLPPLLKKCLKIWERTLSFAQPVFWGVFPNTKPNGAKAIKLPFKIPHVHINPSDIFKIVIHIFKIMQHPYMLMDDVRNLPKMCGKLGTGVIKISMKLVTKLPMKIMKGLKKLSTKLMSGTIKTPQELLKVGKSMAELPFKMLEHVLHPGQANSKYKLNFNYMNKLGKLLMYPHMGDESPKVRNQELNSIVNDSA